jgi:hypothetical protein
VADTQVLNELVEVAISKLQDSNSQEEVIEAAIQKAAQSGISAIDLAKIEKSLRDTIKNYSNDVISQNSMESLRAKITQELAPVVENSKVGFSNNIRQLKNGEEQDMSGINNELEQFNSIIKSDSQKIDTISESLSINQNSVSFNTNSSMFDFGIETYQDKEAKNNNDILHIEDVDQNNSNVEDVDQNNSNLEDVYQSSTNINNSLYSDIDFENISDSSEEDESDDEYFYDEEDDIELDTTPPDAPTISIDDVGTSSSDGVTSSNIVNVAGIEPSAIWEYSLDGGITWDDGVGTTITLLEATYNIGSIKVKQIDLAGNESLEVSNTSSYTIDTTPNATSPTVTTATLENGAGINATVQGAEEGRAYLVKDTNTPTSMSDITSLADNQYNEVDITVANTNTDLPTEGLTPGTYKVYFVDKAGNLTTTASTNTVTVTNDITAPNAPSIALANDTGSNNTDGITSDTTVNVTGLEADATWQYSIDNGSTWSNGSGTSFTLSDATYTANHIQVKQTDVAGNTSAVGKITSQVKIDTSTPTATVTTATIEPSGNAVVQSDQVGTAYLVDSTVSVSTLSDITSLADNKYNSVAVGTANTNTNLAATGLSNGTYKVYTVDEAGNISSASTNSITITAPASVTAVSSSTADATYKVGDTISITVTFDDVVNVTGTPQITLETGTTDRTVDYSSGTGTNTLVFDYTVQAGDISSDLDFSTTTALSLNGGTIKGSNTLDATLTLATPGASGSIADSKAIVVDGVAPTVSSVAITSATGTSNNTLNIGDVVTATVTMSEDTIVTGTPKLALNIGGTTVQASYASGSGTSALLFTYTIQAAQTDANGISVDVNSLSLNGGTIKDSIGNDAVITHSSVTDNNIYKVDTTDPTLSSSMPADEATVAPSSDITLIFSEAVYKGSGNITLYNITSGSNVAQYDVSSATEVTGWGTNTLTINPANDLVGGDSYAIKVDTTALDDAAGNSYAGISDNNTLNFEVISNVITITHSNQVIPAGFFTAAQQTVQFTNKDIRNIDLNGFGSEDIIKIKFSRVDQGVHTTISKNWSKTTTPIFAEWVEDKFSWLYYPAKGTIQWSISMSDQGTANDFVAENLPNNLTESNFGFY